MQQVTVKSFLDSLDRVQTTGNSTGIRLAAAREWACYRTLVDVGLLHETDNAFEIHGLDISRTDITCIDMLDRQLDMEGE
jgi:hypothetical protein